jgi:hypothetical protein
LPLPLAPAVIVTHAAPLDAVQEQPAGAVTATVAELPSASTDTPVGANQKEQSTADCVTVSVWPPMVSVPVLEVPPVFVATLKVTLPLPVPLAPEVMVIHDTELDAVQLQPGPAVTDALCDEPPADSERLVGETLNAQIGAACVIVNVWPAIVSVPVREAVVVFAATL